MEKEPLTIHTTTGPKEIHRWTKVGPLGVHRTILEDDTFSEMLWSITVINNGRAIAHIGLMDVFCTAQKLRKLDIDWSIPPERFNKEYRKEVMPILEKARILYTGSKIRYLAQGEREDDTESGSSG